MPLPWNQSQPRVIPRNKTDPVVDGILGGILFFTWPIILVYYAVAELAQSLFVLLCFVPSFAVMVIAIALVFSGISRLGPWIAEASPRAYAEAVWPTYMSVNPFWRSLCRFLYTTAGWYKMGIIEVS